VPAGAQLRAQVGTPRSIEACLRQGVEPHELIFKAMDKFKTSLGPEGLLLKPHQLQLRYEHFENKRKEKLSQVLKERQKVLREEERGHFVPTVLNSLSQFPHVPQITHSTQKSAGSPSGLK